MVVMLPSQRTGDRDVEHKKREASLPLAMQPIPFSVLEAVSDCAPLVASRAGAGRAYAVNMSRTDSSAVSALSSAAITPVTPDAATLFAVTVRSFAAVKASVCARLRFLRRLNGAVLGLVGLQRRGDGGERGR